MLTQERYHSILSTINEKHAVTVSELSQLLDTSESTIRRDLTVLDRLGKLKKVFGGATSIKQTISVIEDDTTLKETLMREEKTEIARYCATLINDTDFVYIDAGTTTSRLIDYIPETSKAVYVTNGIYHARKLIKRGLNAYIVGGKVKPVTEAVIGAEGISNLKDLNFSKSFIGTNGIDIEAGFTTPDIDEAKMKETAIEKSYMAFVMADHTKFRRVFPVSFSSLRKCCIVTDKVTDSLFKNETVIKEVML